MSGNGKQAPPPAQRYPMACPQRPPTPQRADQYQQPAPGPPPAYAQAAAGVGVGVPASAAAAAAQMAARGAPVGRPLQPPTPPQTDPKGQPYGQQQGRQGQVYAQFRAPTSQQPPTQRPTPGHRQPPTMSYAGYPTMIYPMGMQAYPQQGAQARQQAFFHQQMVPSVPTYYAYPQSPNQYFVAAGSAQPPAPIPMAPGHGPGRTPPVVAQTAQQQPPQQPQHQHQQMIRFPQAMPMAPPQPAPEKRPQRRLHAIAIVDPESGKDVMEDILEPKSAAEEAAKERDRPRPEEGRAVVEEFARLIIEVANERDPDAEPEPDRDRERGRPETPVVSAISDSPEIVPKQGPPHRRPPGAPGHVDGAAEERGRRDAGHCPQPAAPAPAAPAPTAVPPTAPAAPALAPAPAPAAAERERQSISVERGERAAADRIEPPSETIPPPRAEDSDARNSAEPAAIATPEEFAIEREPSISAEETESEEAVSVSESDGRRTDREDADKASPDRERTEEPTDAMDVEEIVPRPPVSVPVQVAAVDEPDEARPRIEIEIRPKADVVLEEKAKDDETANEKADVEDAAEDDSEDDSSMEDSSEVSSPSEEDERPESENVEKPPAAPKLRYAYKEDQWSPLNTSGKKRYDADFLMQLRDDPNSKRKPENILKPELLADNLAKLSRPMGRSMGGNDLMPGFARGNISSAAPNRKSQHGKSNSKIGSLGGPSKPSVININLALRSDVKLNESENAWKPSRADRSATMTDEELETQSIYKKFRSILNKLTPQKFERLVKQVKQLNINTYERLDGVITLVFEKAVNEPNFSVEYANLCKELSKLNVTLTTDQKNYTFEKLIVEKCHDEFYKEDKIGEDRLKEIEECTNPEKKKELKLLLEEEERSVRRRSVGNVRFMGELFKHNFMPQKVIYSCITRLLSKIEEETLECLCKLLTTIGKDLEQNQRKDELNQCFRKIEKIVKERDSRVPSRIRFMLQDVIELRERHWVPRQTQTVKPQMIDQIKLEMELEHKSSYMNYPSGSGQKNDDRPSNMNKRGGSRSVTEDGWSPVSYGMRSRPKAIEKPGFVVDSEKLRTLANTTHAPMSLQPTALASWGRGSNTHKKGDGNAPGAKLLTGNRKNASEITLNNSYAKLEMQYDSAASDEPAELPATKTPYKTKGASIERSTFKFEEKVSDSKDEEIKNRLHSFIQEYGDNPSAVLSKINTMFAKDEYLTVFKELLLWSFSTLEISINRSVGEVTGISVRDKTISNPDYLAALKYASDTTKIFNKADKNCWKSVSALVCTHMKYSNLSIRHIYNAFSKVIELGKGFGLLTYIMIDAGKEMMQNAWKESDMKLSDWMSEDEVEQFIEEVPFSSHFVSEEDELITPDAAYAQMLAMMKEGCSRDELTSWINRHVGESSKDAWFIRALTEAIFMFMLCGSEGAKPRYDTAAEQRLQVYYPLLITHVSNGPELELQCLFAIQNLMHKLEHPRDIARKVFQYFLDAGDVISTKGFIEWKNNDDPHELEGKGVMLKNLNSFFVEIEVYGGETSESENGEDH